MITKLSFGNYRIFKSGDKVEIPFKPITVFVGPNGSGKSSVMRFLKRLSKQEWFKPVYDFGEPFSEEFFEFDLKFDDSWHFYNKGGRLSISENDQVIYNHYVPIENKHFLDRMKDAQYYWYYKMFDLGRFSDDKFLKDIKEEIKWMGYLGNPDNLIQNILLNCKDFGFYTYTQDFLDNATINEHFFLPKLKAIRVRIESFTKPEDIFISVYLLDKWTENIEKHLKEKIRSELSHVNDINLSPISIEKLWNKSARFTHHSSQFGTSKRVCFFANARTFNKLGLHVGSPLDDYEFDCLSIEEQFQRITGKKWVFDIINAGEIVFKAHKKTIGMQNLSLGEKRLLGILFILNARNCGGYYLDNSATYNVYRYFNEPEISLHPAWQSKIAKFLIDQSNFYHAPISWDSEGVLNRCTIIETHSEYLIRGLQYEAMKAKRTEDVQIIYFDGNGGVIPIEINKDGTLTRPFGPGFYDESERLSLLLLDGLANKS